LSVGEPRGSGHALAFGAAPVAAGVISTSLMSAVITAGLVAAQGGGVAELDGPQRPVLLAAQGPAIAFQEGLAMLAHDVGDFELRAAHDN